MHGGRICYYHIVNSKRAFQALAGEMFRAGRRVVGLMNRKAKSRRGASSDAAGFPVIIEKRPKNLVRWKGENTPGDGREPGRRRAGRLER